MDECSIRGVPDLRAGSGLFEELRGSLYKPVSLANDGGESQVQDHRDYGQKSRVDQQDRDNPRNGRIPTPAGHPSLCELHERVDELCEDYAGNKREERSAHDVQDECQWQYAKRDQAPVSPPHPQGVITLFDETGDLLNLLFPVCLLRRPNNRGTCRKGVCFTNTSGR